jgi:aspartate carbamoyltransferase catalytic subunit
LTSWTHRHLLGIDELSPGEIDHVLVAADAELTRARSGERKDARLRGQTVINLFFEASTRTRTSFELAGKRLGADVVNVAGPTSSAVKGETLLDTVKNLEAMHADVLVVRHGSSGAAHFIARRTGASVVNAGDGTHEHPTQALLDALTIRRHKGRLAGLVVAICGDILHSRVARSNALLLGKMGAEVRLTGPRTMMPAVPDALGNTARAFERLEDAVEGADVVMMLRIQRERLAGAMVATTREYSRRFGLGPRVLDLARPDAIVMHPGPINRGVELDPAVADGPRSVILDQVEAGVAVRSAVLALVVGARAAAAHASPSSQQAPREETA